MSSIKYCGVVAVCLTTAAVGRMALTPHAQAGVVAATTGEQPERKIMFTSQGGVKLAGTLLLPAPQGVAKVPGVLLIAGSGPTDRDGNQGQAFHTDLLRQIAAHLAQQGIASLRYDKRGIGGSKMRLEPMTLDDYAAWEGFVDDAIAGLRYLQAQPEIDPTRTGLMGHSEGGLLALQAAHTIATAHDVTLPQMPHVLVLAATPGRHLDAVVKEQLTNLLKRQQATPEQTKFFLEANDDIVAKIRKAGVVPNDVPPGLAALYPAYLGKFYRSALQVDPPQLAAQFPGPVLVLQGEKDMQVQASEDAPALDVALKGRAHDDHELFVVPAASHNLKTVQDETDPGIDGEVALTAMNKLGTWLRAKLMSDKPTK